MDNNELSTNLAEVGTDCISKKQAIDAVEFGITYAKAINRETGEVTELFNESNNELREAVDRIKQLPPIQPKRGRWIHHPEIGWGETWLCDQCGEKTTSTVMGKPRANFCPNCGAKMEVTNGN